MTLSYLARRVRRHRRRVQASSQVLLSDTQWFAAKPHALVRFRPVKSGDFALVAEQGQEAPAFVPPGLDLAAPLTWVAVVDVLRATGLPPQPDGVSLRCRIRTVPIRSRRLQAEMAEVFAIAVCRDVLAQLQQAAAEQVA